MGAVPIDIASDMDFTHQNAADDIRLIRCGGITPALTGDLHQANPRLAWAAKSAEEEPEYCPCESESLLPADALQLQHVHINRSDALSLGL